MKKVEEKFNEAWFGSYKLRANLSKFTRGSLNRNYEEKNKKYDRSNEVTKSVFLKENVSYFDVLGKFTKQDKHAVLEEANRNKSTDRTHKHTGIQFVSMEEDRNG